MTQKPSSGTKCTGSCARSFAKRGNGSSMWVGTRKGEVELIWMTTSRVRSSVPIDDVAAAAEFRQEVADGPYHHDVRGTTRTYWKVSTLTSGTNSRRRCPPVGVIPKLHCSYIPLVLPRADSRRRGGEGATGRGSR